MHRAETGRPGQAAGARVRGLPAVLAACALAAAAAGCGPARTPPADPTVPAAAHPASPCRPAVLPLKGDIEPAFPLPRAHGPRGCAPGR